MKYRSAWIKEKGVWHFIEQIEDNGVVRFAESGDLRAPFDYEKRLAEAEDVVDIRRMASQALSET